MATKQVNDFSPEERQHILDQLKGGLNLQEVARINNTSWQAVRSIQRIAEGDMGQRKTTPEERERIWKRAIEVGFAQAAAENNLSENTILNWQWRYNMPEHSGEEASSENKKKPAYNKVYTPEEKAKILAFAQEAGAVDAARKFNVSTTSIRNWTKQAQQAQQVQQPQTQLPISYPAETEQSVQQSLQPSDQSSVQPSIQEQTQQQPSSVQEQPAPTLVHEEVDMEQGKETVHEEAVQIDPTIDTLLPADSRVRALVARVQELSMEVAVLKERNAVLTKQIEALKHSIMTLIQ